MAEILNTIHSLTPKKAAEAFRNLLGLEKGYTSTITREAEGSYLVVASNNRAVRFVRLAKWHTCVVCNTVTPTETMVELYRQDGNPSFACKGGCQGSERAKFLKAFCAKLEADHAHNRQLIADQRAGKITPEDMNNRWK